MIVGAHRIIRDMLSPYDVLAGMLKTSKRRTLGWAASRQYVLTMSSAAEEFDMFGEYCLECDGPIERDAFGHHVSSSHCVEHSHLGGDEADAEGAKLAAVDHGEAAADAMDKHSVLATHGEGEKPDFELNKDN